MSGGGFGPCGAGRWDDEDRPRFFGRGFRAGGRGLQRGFRRGFCWFNRSGDIAAREGGGGYGYGTRRAGGRTVPEPSPADLKTEAQELRRRLETIEKRLAGSEGPGGEAGGA
jgi:hypothetical protein